MQTWRRSELFVNLRLFISSFRFSRFIIDLFHRHNHNSQSCHETVCINFLREICFENWNYQMLTGRTANARWMTRKLSEPNEILGHDWCADLRVVDSEHFSSLEKKGTVNIAHFKINHCLSEFSDLNLRISNHNVGRNSRKISMGKHLQQIHYFLIVSHERHRIPSENGDNQLKIQKLNCVYHSFRKINHLRISLPLPDNPFDSISTDLHLLSIGRNVKSSWCLQCSNGPADLYFGRMCRGCDTGRPTTGNEIQFS